MSRYTSIQTTPFGMSRSSNPSPVCSKLAPLEPQMVGFGRVDVPTLNIEIRKEKKIRPNRFPDHRIVIHRFLSRRMCPNLNPQFLLEKRWNLSKVVTPNLGYIRKMVAHVTLVPSRLWRIWSHKLNSHAACQVG